MRITPSNPTISDPGPGKRAKNISDPPAEGQEAVRVTLSVPASSASETEAADGARETRVAALHSQIADGSYKVDVDKLAHKLADVIGGAGKK